MRSTWLANREISKRKGLWQWYWDDDEAREFLLTLFSMTCRKPCYIQEIRAPVRLFVTHKLHRSQTPALQPAWVVCKYPVGLQAPCLAIKSNGTWGHVITYKFEQFLLLCAECVGLPRGLETNITFFYYFHCVLPAPRLLSLRTLFNGRYPTRRKVAEYLRSSSTRCL